MARSVSFKRQFDDQLTCGVCLDQYTDPRELPCQHTFCLECVQRLPAIKTNGKDYISCPTCRVDHLLPEKGGAIKLPSDFKTNSMLELRKKLRTSSKREAASSSNCHKHNDPLKVYCETCKKVICCECTIMEHNTHKYSLISKCYPKHHQQLQESLLQIKQEMTNIDVAVGYLDDREKEVLQQGERLTEEINMHAQKMIDQIERSRIRLSQQVDTIVQQKIQTLEAQKQQAQKIHTELKKCQETIEHNLKQWNEQKMLAEKHIMLSEMKKVAQNVNPNVFGPTEKANIELAKTDLLKTKIGIISSTTCSKATFKVPSRFSKNISTTTLNLRTQDDSPFPLPSSLISCTLFSSDHDEVSVKCNITQTNPGEYNITFTPKNITRGEHLLTVQVGGVDIPNSPFTLPMMPIRERQIKTIKGLNNPTGIAVCANGVIVVAECFGNCITLFNKKGEKIKSIEKTTLGQFKGPRGVAISNERHILVTDNHRLQKLTTEGLLMQSVGSSEISDGVRDFDWPSGITVHPTTGEIFVADVRNHRIQVFNGADLSFSHTIKHENITKPWDIAVDSEGYLYISDYDTRKVSKFTTTGQYIQTIPTRDSSTIYLAIHHKHIYVTDISNHRVLIFDTDGKRLHSFGKEGSGEGEFNSPTGIAVDTSGTVYVCDSCNNRIVVY